MGKVKWIEVENSFCDGIHYAIDSDECNHVVLFEHGSWWLTGADVAGANGKAPYRLVGARSAGEAKRTAVSFIRGGFWNLSVRLRDAGIL